MDQNKTGLEGKFHHRLSALKLHSALMAHPLCTFASETPASQTRMHFLNTEDITSCPPATSFCSIFKIRLRAGSKCHEPPQPPVWSKSGLVRAADSMLAQGWVRWLLGLTRCCLNFTYLESQLWFMLSKLMKHQGTCFQRPSKSNGNPLFCQKQSLFMSNTLQTKFLKLVTETLLKQRHHQLE